MLHGHKLKLLMTEKIEILINLSQKKLNKNYTRSCTILALAIVLLQ